MHACHLARSEFGTGDAGATAIAQVIGFNAITSLDLQREPREFAGSAVQLLQ